METGLDEKMCWVNFWTNQKRILTESLCSFAQAESLKYYIYSLILYP